MALPTARGGQAVASGPALAEATLVAPLSGRACVAYEVAVRHDANADAELSTWALVEQRHVALEIGGTRLDADDAHLDLPRELHVVRDPARVQQYLRERGVDPHATELVIFETIVEPGATVRMRVSANGSTITKR
jgi:hypothetical protein